MAILIGCIALGVFFGWNRLLPQKILAMSGKIITLAIMFLLITMGLRIGLDKETLGNLGQYGLQAFCFALMTILFSLGTVSLLERVLAGNLEIPAAGKLEVKPESQAHPYRMTIIIIGAFFLGVLLGFFVVPASINAILPTLTTWALNFTLFTVGIDLGLNKEMWKQFITIGRYVFLAPLGVSLGSVLAGMITGKVLGWTYWEGGAVGAGFGWYSLSGVMISELHSVALGTTAFLSNVMREVISILIIPFIAGRVGKFTLVAPGGATTMDTTLPVIAAVGPPGIAIIAFINGVVLSSLVPILVPLLLGQTN
ncbi:MAG: lysine exporter LysO family protein [Peptococcaceae bacterium]|nr:lysine exporter LysO family protein [Peptococcaceae bacterium]